MAFGAGRPRLHVRARPRRDALEQVGQEVVRARHSHARTRTHVHVHVRPTSWHTHAQTQPYARTHTPTPTTTPTPLRMPMRACSVRRRRYKLAATQGERNAQFLLGGLLLNTRGEKALPMVMRLCRQAASQAHIDAIDTLLQARHLARHSRAPFFRAIPCHSRVPLLRANLACHSCVPRAILACVPPHRTRPAARGGDGRWRRI